MLSSILFSSYSFTNTCANKCHTNISKLIRPLNNSRAQASLFYSGVQYNRTFFFWHKCYCLTSTFWSRYFTNWLLLLFLPRLCFSFNYISIPEIRKLIHWFALNKDKFKNKCTNTPFLFCSISVHLLDVSPYFYFEIFYTK